MVEGERPALGYAIYQRGMPGSAQVHDATMAIAFNIMRTLCGPTWRPTEVRFAHRQPPDVQAYRRFFRAPLRFDTDRTEVGFPRRWLDRPLPGSDAELHRFLQGQVAERETSSEDGPGRGGEPCVAGDARSRSRHGGARRQDLLDQSPHTASPPEGAGHEAA